MTFTVRIADVLIAPDMAVFTSVPVLVGEEARTLWNCAA